MAARDPNRLQTPSRRGPSRVKSVVGPFAELASERVSTGIAGLDEILEGGFLKENTYVVRGGPGSGKTLLGMHYLAAATPAETSLCVAMVESQEQLCQNAFRLGMDLSRVTMLDLSPLGTPPAVPARLVSAAEIDTGTLIDRIVKTGLELRPTRVFFDFTRTLRLLSPDPYQYRTLVISLLRFFTTMGATLLIASEAASLADDDDLTFLADGVIELDSKEYEGRLDRRIAIRKRRGAGYHEGGHGMRIDATGVTVTPRLRLAETPPRASHPTMSSGLPALDAMLHGGLERGTVTFLSGPTGTGKTTLGLQLMQEAARRGERSALYSFEEEISLMAERAAHLGIPVAELQAAGQLALVKVGPYELSADEFACRVREEVEQRGARMVVVDSAAGYELSIRGENPLHRLHALCKYLQERGVTVLVIQQTATFPRGAEATLRHSSYLADNILLTGYQEIRRPDGGLSVRSVMMVLKKRLSDFSREPHELRFTPQGLELRGPLLDIPTFLGAPGAPVE